MRLRSHTLKPDPRVLDPIQVQGVATNYRRRHKYYYTQHKQNNVLLLEGDLLFNVKSDAHQHQSNGTLILRSLPALNYLLREAGPHIAPLDIWTYFKYMGAHESDVAYGTHPLMRMCTIATSGLFRATNLFDDWSHNKPQIVGAYPRHAYLMLLPYCDDSKGQPAFFSKRKVPLVADDGGDDRADAGVADILRLMTADVLVSGLPLYDPIDDFDDDIDVLDAKEEEARKRQRADEEEDAETKKNALPQRPKELYPRYGHYPQWDDEYYWQFIPVCSIHCDLMSGAPSADKRSWGNPFVDYDFGIYLGEIVGEPMSTGPPNRIDDVAVKYATHGPFGIVNDYIDTMANDRPQLKSVFIKSPDF